MAENNLWYKFNFAEHNHDQGAGILYCLRYSEDRIKSHHESIVDALTSIGIELEEVEGGIAAKLSKDIDESQLNRIYMLLEELSCLNEALEYTAAGYGQFNDVGQLRRGLIQIYCNLLREYRMADAYDLVTRAVPQIVKDIMLADRQNGILSASSRKELTDLVHFVERQKKFADNLWSKVLFSTH